MATGERALSGGPWRAKAGEREPLPAPANPCQCQSRRTRRRPSGSQISCRSQRHHHRLPAPFNLRISDSPSIPPSISFLICPPIGHPRLSLRPSERNLSISGPPALQRLQPVRPSHRPIRVSRTIMQPALSSRPTSSACSPAALPAPASAHRGRPRPPRQQRPLFPSAPPPATSAPVHPTVLPPLASRPRRFSFASICTLL